MRGVVLLLWSAWVSVALGGDVDGIPCVIWSNVDNRLPGSHEYLSLGASGVSQSDVIGMVENAAKEDVGAVAVFMAPAMNQLEFSKAVGAYGTGNGAIEFIKSSVEKSKASLVLPYTFKDNLGGTISPWSKWFFSLPEERAIHLDFTEQEVQVVLAQLDQALKAKAGPVVLIVSLSSDPYNWDKAVKQVSLALKERSVSYISVLTALNHLEAAPNTLAAISMLDLSSQHESLGKRQLSVIDPLNGGLHLGTTLIRVTPAAMFAFLMTLFLLVFLLGFLCCFDTLQTPTRFATSLPPIGKLN